MKSLFDLDVDSIIWRENGLQDPDGSTVPRWMADEDVRRGILAFLEATRCHEELSRLSQEKTALVGWLSHRWRCTVTALTCISKFIG